MISMTSRGITYKLKPKIIPYIQITQVVNYTSESLPSGLRE